MRQGPKGGWLILLSLLLAFMLSAIPLPEMLQWGRPEWVAMALIYWVMALPERVGVKTAWICGLLLDLLQSSPLGANAIGLTVVAYLTTLLHQRLRNFPLIQQSFVVLMLIGILQMVRHWLQQWQGGAAESLIFMLPSLISALLWPWWFVVHRDLRRIFVS
ncbi:rod shape-determining protein MreD [Pokkaliibacter plantistimulans]|uniref:Rod shape-determining protein MreD n=2 Tax=Pseudomonadota TaxID=1224 RepID=A0ABX5M2G8_9GAMM|nr:MULTISPECIES: rod shape-determining protein MreD [Pokkaliibacter]MDH2431683.1 rod shape-determining protein MreD [Pokkaliibacter sp. MBI-7]PPC74754.1 rod shape-determining protein MreD [Pokkaliibacter plantistimulans]PXF31708.1 rod shape-determining protein MreD [Pokkaliibacter plantistimulans]